MEWSNEEWDGVTYGTNGVEEKCIHSFGGETWGKDIALKTKLNWKNILVEL